MAEQETLGTVDPGDLEHQIPAAIKALPGGFRNRLLQAGLGLLITFGFAFPGPPMGRAAGGPAPGAAPRPAAPALPPAPEPEALEAGGRARGRDPRLGSRSQATAPRRRATRCSPGRMSRSPAPSTGRCTQASASGSAPRRSRARSLSRSPRRAAIRRSRGLMGDEIRLLPAHTRGARRSSSARSRSVRPGPSSRVAAALPADKRFAYPRHAAGDP